MKILIVLIIILSLLFSSNSYKVMASEMDNVEYPVENINVLDDETTITVTLTEEEKGILLDSIQVIRAILVFFLVCLVVYAIIKFLGIFF